MKGLLTVTQAAEQLGIHADSLRQRIHAGSLKAERVGSVWLIDVAEVERYRAESLGKRGRKKKEEHEP